MRYLGIPLVLYYLKSIEAPWWMFAIYIMMCGMTILEAW